MARVSSLLAFAAILVACLAGAFTLSWWLACAATAILVLVSLSERAPSYHRYASAASAGAQSVLLRATTVNVATALGAGYVVGRALATLWLA